jgi:hypothetical protein
MMERKIPRGPQHKTFGLFLDDESSERIHNILVMLTGEQEWIQ